MSQRRYTAEYFQNREQQANLRQAILHALPDDGTVYLYNLIIVLAELLKDFTHRAFTEEVFTRSVKDKNGVEI